jgi:hypothetical protein
MTTAAGSAPFEIVELYCVGHGYLDLTLGRVTSIVRLAVKHRQKPSTTRVLLLELSPESAAGLHSFELNSHG